MSHAERIHIGTSGWSYTEWKGAFYPERTPARAFLEYYARHFGSVEINSSFYRLPSEETLIRWRDAVPANFRFSAKASRYITHMKKLKDPKTSMRKFIERAAVLGDKLGPILFQLPPGWGFDEGRLATFLQALDQRHRYAIEFRDPSWFDDRAYRLLAQHDAALCIYDLDGRQSSAKLTADFVYVRLHGPNGPYRGSYDKAALSAWAGTFSDWAEKGRAVYCYFDNDEKGFAVKNALALQQMLWETRGETERKS